jgi:hypothetical protein
LQRSEGQHDDLTRLPRPRSNHRNERDQAVAERAEVLAILSNVRAMVEKAEIPMPLRRKRNGNGGVVADNDSEQLAIGGSKQSSTASGVLQHCVENRIKIARRRADNAQYISCSCAARSRSRLAPWSLHGLHYFVWMTSFECRAFARPFLKRRELPDVFGGRYRLFRKALLQSREALNP